MPLYGGQQLTTSFINYEPLLPATGDLETATRNISATAEASGLANADYSKALTLPAPDDARLAVLRIAARLSVTIDNLNSASELNCRVYVDAQDADHRLFDITGASKWTSTGNKLAAVDTHAAALAVIFNALKNGAAHTFYFYFWSDNATGPTISEVQLWEAVGSCNTVAGQTIASVTCPGGGIVTYTLRAITLGSGTGVFIQSPLVGSATLKAATSANLTQEAATIVVANGYYYIANGSVATDLNYLHRTSVAIAR